MMAIKLVVAGVMVNVVRLTHLKLVWEKRLRNNFGMILMS